jgi:hypothetical protein
MHIAHRAVVVACVIFAAAVFGEVLQWLLPSHHLADAKGTITAVQGLVTLLLTLVLADMGVSYAQSARWQALADLSDDEFALALSRRLRCCGGQARDLNFIA